MRRETNHRRGFLLFEQICDKALERDLSLRERSLIESGKDLSCLDQGNQFLKEIGRHDLDLPKEVLFLKSPEDGNAVRCADVQTLRLRFAVQQCDRLPIGFLGTFMGLDRRQQVEMRSEHGKWG